MPDYVPPPASLDHLNPIQRYMQKGQLEFQDYVNLVLLVLAYFVGRPYIEAGMKWILEDKNIKEGEQAQKEFLESQEKAKVGANEIRGATKGTNTTTLTSNAEGSTGTDVKPANNAVNRKSKPVPEGEVPAPTAEQLLEWDDIVTTGTTPGAKTDVMSWVNKWDE